MNITLRPAQAGDAAFVERVYFETQRWIIERLFGWRGDGFEVARFRSHYHLEHTQIVSRNGVDIGWLTVIRSADAIDLHSIYIATDAQGAGIGTFLLQRLVAEATEARKPLKLGTAKINPALRLYTRLGFRPEREDEFKVYLRYERRQTRSPINP